MSNRPPAAILELTAEQAKIMMMNSNSSLKLALTLMNMQRDRKNAEKLVAFTETFKEVRRQLIQQGIKDDE